MSSLHGDAAVARLDAAVDAFLDIMTAPEHTLVQVPERSPQPSLAERARVNLKPSTDLAKGYAGSARRSAQEAAQIAGLDTVADAIGLAALPLPDVWAPLSDSLRLITGYGRDVLVGSDVVARMVNFSRSTTATYIGKDGVLKTAEVNEPRFEKEGLLIEGQSTNIWPSQSALELVNATLASTSLPDGTTGNIYKITPTAGAYAYVRKNFAAQSGSNTLSCYAKLDDGSMAMPSIYGGSNGEFSAKLAGTYIGNGWWRMQAVFTAPKGNIGFGYPPGVAETIPVWVCNFQLEALPFASSYIPTNGAAVTRGADVAQLPALGNIVPLGFAVSAEFDTQRVSVSTISENTCLFSMEQVDRARMAVIRGKYGSGDADYGFATHCGAYGQAGYVTTVLRDFTVKDRKGVVVISEGGGFLKMRVNSSFSSLSSSNATAAPLTNTIYLGAFGGGGLQTLFGHLRNLRIWQRPLTDAQLKAIAA
ncbi:phage head spike fiber domain-containing protein [Aeromonas salmonicida]|uniref:phage head spike fiber domain-containing protein n=1 Tax=Aeromonas salmonicida TaxID=645 RepID=UPI00259DE7F2|nr:hypothetical protein [Aeromonas salmonicida]MDM5128229.1 hypothetical protein [Aeromonas salmonicida]